MQTSSWRGLVMTFSIVGERGLFWIMAWPENKVKNQGVRYNPRVIDTFIENAQLKKQA